MPFTHKIDKDMTKAQKSHNQYLFRLAESGVKALREAFELDTNEIIEILRCGFRVRFPLGVDSRHAEFLQELSDILTDSTPPKPPT